MMELRKARNLAWAIGALAVAIAGMASPADPTAFFSSYLVAFMLCMGLTVASTGLWMVHMLVGGAWGIALKETFQAGSRQLGLVSLLFLPIAFGLPHLYPWAQKTVLETNHHISQKQWYLNPRDYLLRSALFFAVWGVFSWLMNRADAGNSKLSVKAVSALGIICFGFAITFSAIDWVMSLEPFFYSTIYGLIFLVGHVGSVFALGIVILAFWPPATRAGFPEERSLHDVGNFLLMSVLLWAYMSFSQLILIWSAQLPEEVVYYNYRFDGGWNSFGFGLVLLHFVLPFLLLLFRRIKRDVRMLAWVAILFIAVRWLDLVWNVQPNFSPKKLQVPWQMLILSIGLLGLWFGSFLFSFERRRHG